MVTYLNRMFLALGVTICICATMIGAATLPQALAASEDEDKAIANSLAAMLRAGRTVISRNQERINNPDLGDKGLEGKIVLAQAQKIYQEATKVDPLTVDPASRHGKLLRAQMDAIVEVMDSNQKTLNQKGVGFKGLIPATFGRLVNEAFGKSAGNDAEMKVTAPPDLVRNRKARPDEWEAEVIRDKLLQANWPKGQLFATVAANKGRQAFRVAVPEYYAASCLSCHGGPKGQIDITGYPKEGASEGDLGGVISITLFH
jgi:cytochrome c553